MILSKEIKYRVLLPSLIWEQAHDNSEFKRLILKYMKRYENYNVNSVENGFAICTRKEG